jgi:hypothetical protein
MDYFQKIPYLVMSVYNALSLLFFHSQINPQSANNGQFF